MASNLRDIDRQGHMIDRSLLTPLRSSIGMYSKCCGLADCELGQYHIAKLDQGNWHYLTPRGVRDIEFRLSLALLANAQACSRLLRV